MCIYLLILVKSLNIKVKYKEVSDKYTNTIRALKEYEKEGRTHLIIGIGCTGGQHRSVSLTNYFADHYSEIYHVHRFHRDAVH